MPSKKHSRGVLQRIGDAATSAAGVVINVGSKALHAVGDMLPTPTPQESANASSRGSKVKAVKARTSKAAPKAMAKTAKPKEKIATKTKTAAPKTKKAAMKQAAPTKPAKPSAKPKRRAAKKG